MPSGAGSGDSAGGEPEARFVAEVRVRRCGAADHRRLRPEATGGTRDRAILLLLARLGLRGSDIVQMRLCDIDWARARLLVAGKGRREALLQLPQEVGDALLSYLGGERPAVGSDRVFLSARAPWRPFGGSTHAEDPRHEIPPDRYFPGRRHRPVPYIYTADEARRLVEAAAQLGPAPCVWVVAEGRRSRRR